jgi:Tol biopolymer transport system component
LAFTAGSCLGSYEVGALLGAGGMGEVYRAKDTKLGRDVALKILPASFTNDPERVARFRREAQVLASLNHPHIAQIHGMEEADGTQFLVLELVDGESLDKRIARGAIPVDEALGIAKQIAEALEAAHEKGIIHRDLKPANIALTKDGSVKVLDFGLAKAVEATGSMSNVSMSPTITTPAMMTGIGVVLGTAAYMSPEQAKGRAADRRADIWAFGCVLFEMLTGKRVFEGEDATEVLARIIEREPDFAALPPMTPPALRRLLRRSLAKDCKRRLADISDARLDIDEALTPVSPENAEAITTGPQRGDRITWLFRAIALVVISALAIPATLYFRRVTGEPVVTRLDVVTPPTTDPFSFALSPDGRQLVFAGNGERGSQLWIRFLDQVIGRPLAGTEGATYPFWSPDGRAIGFFADDKLKRLDLPDGVAQVVADAPGARGGTWNRDGVILFGPQVGGLLRVAASGGTPSELTHLAAGEGSHRWPQFLPDGRRFLFMMAMGQARTHGVYLGSLEGREPVRLLVAETAGMYVPPGYLLNVVSGTLVAHRFDADRGVVNDSVPVAQSVGTDDGTFRSAFSVSDAGVLAHRPGGGGRRQLAWVDRSGKVVGVIGPPDDATPGNPALAPGGRQVAVSRLVQSNMDIWLVEIGRGIFHRFTFDPATDSQPVWSPDGSRIVFNSIRNGKSDLFEKPVDGTTDERPLLATAQDKVPLDWSSDGQVLLYQTQDPKTGSDIWALPLIGERKPFPVAATSFDEREGQFSPNGQWVAYVSNETGRDEVYVRPFPARGGKVQMSTAGGIDPRWRRDGKELFYVAPDGHLMAAPIQVTGDALNPGAPVRLFRPRFATGGNVNIGWLSRPQYAVAADGRFLMNVSTEDAVALPITIVQNWTLALKK